MKNREQACAEYAVSKKQIAFAREHSAFGHCIMNESFNAGWDACAEQKSPPGVRIVPWMELRHPTGYNYDENDSDWNHFLKGWELWQLVGAKTCWITTTADACSWFLEPGLLPAGVSLGLISGSLPQLQQNLVDHAGWTALGNVCAKIKAATDQTDVLLDNEGLLKPIIDENAQMPSLGYFSAGLIQMRAAAGDGFICNLPSILGNTTNMSDREVRTTNLVDIFSRVLPGAKYMVAYTWHPKCLGDADRIRRRQIMADMVGTENMIPRILIGEPEWYSPSGALAHTFREGGEVSLWTGGKNWRSVPEQMLELR